MCGVLGPLAGTPSLQDRNERDGRQVAMPTRDIPNREGLGGHSSLLYKLQRYRATGDGGTGKWVDVHSRA